MAQAALNNRGEAERIAVLESSLDTHLRDCADSRREQAEAMRELRAELRQPVEAILGYLRDLAPLRHRLPFLWAVPLEIEEAL